MSGNFCMMGYAADFISEQDVADFCSDMPDNIVAEAASILFAVAWLLTQEAVPATIHYDCTAVGCAVDGEFSPSENAKAIIAVTRALKC